MQCQTFNTSAKPLSPDPVASDDERGLPKQPKRPIVQNPSTPGVQTPNKPDGRDVPSPDHEKRGSVLFELANARARANLAQPTPTTILGQLARADALRTIAAARTPKLALRDKYVEVRRSPRGRESAPRGVARRRPATRRTARVGSRGDPDPDAAPPRGRLPDAEAVA